MSQSRDKTPYAVLAWKAAQPTPNKFYYTDPIEALLGAVNYLREGYQVRLSDGCVEWFGHHVVPGIEEHLADVAGARPAAGSDAAIAATPGSVERGLRKPDRDHV